MAHTNCLVSVASTVSDHHKNTLRKASASSGHITKLEQSTFLDIYGCTSQGSQGKYAGTIELHA